MMHNAAASNNWERHCPECGGRQICSVDLRGDAITYTWNCTNCGAMEARLKRRGQDRKADEPPIDLRGE